MKNYGIIKFKDAGVKDFTSDVGMSIRKIIDAPLRKVLKMATKGDLITMNYPELEKGKPYIFVSLHNFIEDSIANLSTIDRNAYMLFGTSDQLEVNKEMYAAWLNGFIYVDRLNDKSRKDATKKMARVLNHGNSVLIFPEGSLNNTYNTYCQKLFSSPYYLARETGLEVVPIAPLYEFGSKEIYMNVGSPIDLAKFDNKEEANLYLRDVLSTLLHENLLENSTPLVRSELGEDPTLDYMEQRRQEYMKTKWTNKVNWNEELTQYKTAADKEYISVQESMDNIIITKDNAHIMAPILVRREEDKKHDFKKFMNEKWQEHLLEIKKNTESTEENNQEHEMGPKLVKKL